MVSVTPFVSDHLKTVANVLLPSAAFTETSGTFINLAGEKQAFMGCVKPRGEARPAWKIYRVLGNLLGASHFDFESSEEIAKVISAESLSDGKGNLLTESAYELLRRRVSHHEERSSNVLELITLWPDCRSDALVRRAAALNERAAGKQWESVHIHPETAKQHRLMDGQAVTLRQGERQLLISVVFDEEVAFGAILIAGGTMLASQFNATFDGVEILC